MSHGMVREKPNNKEEAREFIKGSLNWVHSCPLLFLNSACFSGQI